MLAHFPTNGIAGQQISSPGNSKSDWSTADKLSVVLTPPVLFFVFLSFDVYETRESACGYVFLVYALAIHSHIFSSKENKAGSNIAHACPS